MPKLAAAEVHRPRHRARQGADAAPARPPRPALQAIREDVDEIIEALLLKAKRGSYLHAKFLFDYAGLGSASDEARAAHEQSLAELLLEKLDLENC